MVGHVALAFISRSDRDPIVRVGVFTNRVMNLWAVAAISFVLLAVYFLPLREALHFAHVVPSDLMVCAALALLFVAPAELRKAFGATLKTAEEPATSTTKPVLKQPAP